MNTQMSQKTRQEVLVQMRRRCLRAGRKYKAQLLDERVALLGYHRKAAVRALRSKPAPATAPFALRGIDSDNGGKFINQQLKRSCAAQEPAILFTRSRAYQKNDQAHVEQKNEAPSPRGDSPLQLRLHRPELLQRLL